jgi:hypothetical protein
MTVISSRQCAKTRERPVCRNVRDARRGSGAQGGATYALTRLRRPSRAQCPETRERPICRNVRDARRSSGAPAGAERRGKRRE